MSVTKIKTYTESYRDETDTRRIVDQLFKRSQWFAVTPLPDGEFDVTVKEENRRMLSNMRQGEPA